jgi:hypothetical protein
MKQLSILFDHIHRGWEKPKFIKTLSLLVILTYFISLLLIFLHASGLINNTIIPIPTNHFKAIELVFTLLLFFEVISLVFSLEKSISGSMVIQLEILSLILLRSAFKVFGELPNDFQWEELTLQALNMFADAFGALIIFTGIILIKKYEKPLPICQNQDSLVRFIHVKKVLALLMLVIFSGLILTDIIYFFSQKETFNFFHSFYTILIFTDILIVLISLRYENSYLLLFRNSGYALATVIIRLALSAPPPINAALGITAMLFIFSIVLVYNKLGNLYQGNSLE